MLFYWRLLMVPNILRTYFWWAPWIVVGLPTFGVVVQVCWGFRRSHNSDVINSSVAWWLGVRLETGRLGFNPWPGQQAKMTLCTLKSQMFISPGTFQFIIVIVGNTICLKPCIFFCILGCTSLERNRFHSVLCCFLLCVLFRPGPGFMKNWKD